MSLVWFIVALGLAGLIMLIVLPLVGVILSITMVVVAVLLLGLAVAFPLVILFGVGGDCGRRRAMGHTFIDLKRW